MATLNDVLGLLKRNTIDRLGSNLGWATNQAKQNFSTIAKQGQNFFTQKAVPQIAQAQRNYNQRLLANDSWQRANNPIYSFLNDAKRYTDKAGYGLAESFRSTAPSIFGQSNAAIQKSYADKLREIGEQNAQRARSIANFNPVGARKLLKTSQGYLDKSADIYKQRAQDSLKTVTDTAQGLAGSAAYPLGANYAFKNPIMTGLGGALGAGFNALQGGSLAEGFGQGASTMTRGSAVYQVTNPAIAKAVSKVGGAFANPKLSLLTRMGVSGLGNVVEDEITSKAFGDPVNRGLSFLFGAVGGTGKASPDDWAKLNTNAKRELSDIVSKVKEMPNREGGFLKIDDLSKEKSKLNKVVFGGKTAKNLMKELQTSTVDPQTLRLQEAQYLKHADTLNQYRRNLLNENPQWSEDNSVLIQNKKAIDNALDNAIKTRVLARHFELNPLADTTTISRQAGFMKLDEPIFGKKQPQAKQANPNNTIPPEMKSLKDILAGRLETAKSIDIVGDIKNALQGQENLQKFDDAKASQALDYYKKTLGESALNSAYEGYLARPKDYAVRDFWDELARMAKIKGKKSFEAGIDDLLKQQPQDIKLKPELEAQYKEVIGNDVQNVAQPKQTNTQVIEPQESKPVMLEDIFANKRPTYLDNPELGSFTPKTEITSSAQAEQEANRFLKTHHDIGKNIVDEADRLGIGKENLVDALQYKIELNPEQKAFIDKVQSYVEGLHSFRENELLGQIEGGYVQHIIPDSLNGVHRVLLGENLLIPERAVELGSTMKRTGKLEETGGYSKDFEQVWGRMGEEAMYDKYGGSFDSPREVKDMFERISNAVTSDLQKQISQTDGRMKGTENTSGSTPELKGPFIDFVREAQDLVPSNQRKTINYRPNQFSKIDILAFDTRRFNHMLDNIGDEDPALQMTMRRLRDWESDRADIIKNIGKVSDEELAKQAVNELGFNPTKVDTIIENISGSTDQFKELYFMDLTKHLFRKRLQDFILEIGKRNFHPETQDFLNQQIGTMMRDDVMANSLITKGANLLTGLAYRAQIWGNLSVALIQKMEGARMLAMENPEIVAKAIAKRASEIGKRDILKDYNFTEADLTEIKKLHQVITDTKNPILKGIAKTDEKVGKVGQAMVKFMEDSKNRDFLTLAELKGQELGLKGKELKDYVRDYLFTYGYIIDRFNTPLMLKKNPISRLMWQYTQFVFKDLDKTYDIIYREKNIPKAIKYFVLPKIVQGVAMGAITGAGFGSLNQVLGGSLGVGPVPSAIKELVLLGKQIYDENQEMQKDPEYQGKTASIYAPRKIANLLIGNVVPFGVQARKTITQAKNLMQGYAETPEGRIKYHTSTRPINNLQSLVFGQSVDTKNKDYYNTTAGKLLANYGIGDKLHHSLSQSRSQYLKDLFKTNPDEARNIIDSELQGQEIQVRSRQGLSEKDKKAFEEFYPQKKKDAEGNYYPNYEATAQAAHAKLKNPLLLEMVTREERDKAEKAGLPLNPFYMLTPERQRVILRLQTLPPGDPEKKGLRDANSDWINTYYLYADVYNDEAKRQGIYSINPYYEAERVPTPDELKFKLWQYNQLPQGTGDRKAFLNQNPDVLEFFNKSSELTDNKRTKLELPPIDRETGKVSGSTSLSDIFNPSSLSKKSKWDAYYISKIAEMTDKNYNARQKALKAAYNKVRKNMPTTNIKKPKKPKSVKVSNKPKLKTKIKV